jgi:NAD(P)-dependent dehydrogenase (short-subunit alcohol dehydrogenase family)
LNVAIVTGGSRGIGKSIAINSARRGVGIILTYNSHPEEGEAVAAEIVQNGGRAVALKLDVTRVASFADFTARVRATLRESFGRDTFDYLVNNAGFAQRVSIADTTEDQFDQLCNVHLKGPFFLTQSLLPVIADGGQILNISTGLTRFAHPGVATYAAMKAAIECLTVYFAKEFGPRKIRANVVAPGAIQSDFGGGKTDEADRLISAQTALGRLGQPDDVGLLVAGLLSDDSRWVNAQRIEASGGMYL